MDENVTSGGGWPSDDLMEAFNNDPTLGGTVRALAAAVMRLADENLALSEMVTTLSRKLEEVAGQFPVTMEIGGADGETTTVTVGLEEAGDDDAPAPAFGMVFGEVEW